MKKLAFYLLAASLTLSTQIARAEQAAEKPFKALIVCGPDKNGDIVSANVHDMKAAMAKPSELTHFMAIKKSGKVIAKGSFFNFQYNFEDRFIRGLILGFIQEDEEKSAVLGVGIPGMKELAVGDFSGKADLFFVNKATHENVDATSVDCKLSIRQ